MSEASKTDLLREEALKAALADIATKRTGTLDGDVGQLRDGIVRVCGILEGVTEEGTSNRGYFVNQFTAETHAPGQSWCLGYVQRVISWVCAALGRPDVADYNTAGTQAFAADAIKDGTTIPVDKAGIADVFIWQQKLDPIHGHTGFLTGYRGDGGIQCSEGNTSSKEASRDGGTVAYHTYPNGTGATLSRKLRVVVSLYSLAARAWGEKP